MCSKPAPTCGSLTTPRPTTHSFQPFQLTSAIAIGRRKSAMNVAATDWKREYQTPHGLTVRPASPIVGARILGVDVSQPLSDAVFNDILDTWHRFSVVVFPGQ